MSASAKPQRTGVIARKIGMTRMFAADGTHIPVTVLRLERCQVVEMKTVDRDGYDAVLLGAGSAKTKNVSKAQRGQFGKAEVECKQRLVEFRVEPDGALEIGVEISAEHFVVGQLVDVRAQTQGKGFQGAMKRWGFAGLRATHGVSVSHRSHGSTGNRQDPGRVFKNKKMAGQMGGKMRTQQNLLVVAVESERGLIHVKGSVPGSKDGWVEVRDAVKQPLHPEAPVPAGLLSNQLVESAPPGNATVTLADHIAEMRALWVEIVNRENPKRLDAAYKLYLRTNAVMKRLKRGEPIEDAQDRMSLEGLPSAAQHILVESEHGLSRIGALLLALVRNGPRSELDVEPDGEWLPGTKQVLRDAVEEFVREQRIGCIVRHALKQASSGPSQSIFGRLEFFNQMPGLELNGPVSLAPTAWVHPDVDIKITATLNAEGERMRLEPKARPAALLDRDIKRGVFAALDLSLTAQDLGEDPMLELRPSISGHWLNPIFIDVEKLPRISGSD